MFGSNRPNQLEVVCNLDQIQPAIDTMVEQGMPGFQVAADVASEQAVLDKVATAVQRYYPPFEFNHTYDVAAQIAYWSRKRYDVNFHGQTRLKDVGLHFDQSLIGVRVHQMRQGSGEVDLWQGISPINSYDSSSPNFKDKEASWIRRNTEGPRFTGRLLPGVATVFAQHLYTDSATMHPALHNFRSSPGQEDGRTWINHGCDYDGLRRNGRIGWVDGFPANI
jgi:hypothetical protein